MLVVEDNSSKTTCCQRRPSEGLNGYEKKCLGSRCMAWHWHDFYLEEGKPESAVRREYGYCGLAGAPTRADVEWARADCLARREQQEAGE